MCGEERRPRVGSSANSTPGSRTIQRTPITANIANQPSITGPNTLPTEPVPCLWMRNSPISTTNGDGQDRNLRVRRSDVQAFDGRKTEIAGVMAPSAKNRDAPRMPSVP